MTKVKQIQKSWEQDPRWKGIKRPYSAEDVTKLQGSLVIEHTLAKLGAKKLWKLLSENSFTRSLGAMSGNQAVQQVKAGLKAIYASGWQVAADMNDSHQTYPDQSLYPVQSMPHLICRINSALMRQDQIHHLQQSNDIDWFVPIVADAEAGFGGNLNTFELIRAMIESGASAVHLEDQLSAMKKCGHMGGKVVVPTNKFIEKLVSARLAADVLEVPTLIIARTDSLGAKLIESSDDSRDLPFITEKRSEEGFYYTKNHHEFSIARGLAFAPYADLIWCETSTPDLVQAKEFADGIHAKYPGKWLAYNCSPSFNWSAKLDKSEIATFQEKLAEMGYRFQFVTLAGFHTLNASMFQLAKDYKKSGMMAYSTFQDLEFELEKQAGFEAIKHQAFVGAGYFDQIQMTINKGKSATCALKGSTEEEQF